jgi:hypothetical protein
VVTKGRFRRGENKPKLRTILKCWQFPVVGVCIVLAACIGAAAALAQATKEAPNPGAPPPISAFDIPRILHGRRAVEARAQNGDLTAAEAMLNTLIARYPSVAVLDYDSAVLLLRQDRKDLALQSLARAVEGGLPGALLERTPAFRALGGDPTFQKLIAAAKQKTPQPEIGESVTPVQPSLVDNGAALVSAANTMWDLRLRMLRSLFRFSDNGAQEKIVSGGGSLDAARLNAWFLDGTAAGNHGDLYDNRDGGHSALPPAAFPQLARVQYGEEARKTGLDRGLNSEILFNAVTLGNASLALTEGPLWRSLPREALIDPLQVASLYQQYAGNHIYVYPAHRDYAPASGDLITANTPYLLISQGSSGSDQPLLRAVAAILAAFRPDVKAFLVSKGLISPTVQWIFRRGQTGVYSDDDYLSGRAHPDVFSGERLNVLNMIERAHNLNAGDVPPMVHLRVTEESHGKAGVDMMLPDSDESLFDTPSAIARVIRSTAYAKRLVVDASDTVDPNGRPLTFRWSVLHGDTNHITIRPLNDQGSIAEIIVPWHERAPIAEQRDVTSDRVDIGVFANNGKYWSAPAFISLLFPGNEKRLYRPDGQIAEVDYDDPHYRERYVDPLLFPIREWRDSYLYDKSRHLVGWTRFRGEAISHFARDGARVIDSDERGRPLRAERVRYELKRRPDGELEVLEVPSSTIVTYSYANDDDRIGTPIKTNGG